MKLKITDLLLLAFIWGGCLYLRTELPEQIQGAWFVVPAFFSFTWLSSR